MKLWNPSTDTDRLIEQYTVGSDYETDLLLVPYDCRASIAHARMLGGIGILDAAEVEQLIQGLEEIIALAERGEFSIAPEQEDCHTAIEQYLTENIGEAGEKIHTGRSRNDQVLTALRLLYKDSIDDIADTADSLISIMESFDSEFGTVKVPGYTHTRKAMPSSMGMWITAYRDGVSDDLKLLGNARSLINQSPLGTGAGYGTPLELDRQCTSQELGFERIQENPVYAQHSRGKFDLLILQTCVQIMYDMNRMASDLILFSMPQFGFFRLPEKFCTGSSIMPQKRNPDVLELVRSKYHTICGYESQLQSQSANLISGYHRDLQLGKEPVIQGLQITLGTLEVMARVVGGLEVDTERCAEELTEELYATERAYDLVREGVPFREAYRRISGEFREKKP